jgi:hypothetical protein
LVLRRNGDFKSPRIYVFRDDAPTVFDHGRTSYAFAKMPSLSVVTVALFTLASRVAATCTSYGYDFVNGGGPYCINTTSTAYFAFGTEFFGQSSHVILTRHQAEDYQGVKLATFRALSRLLSSTRTKTNTSAQTSQLLPMDMIRCRFGKLYVSGN